MTLIEPPIGKTFSLLTYSERAGLLPDEDGTAPAISSRPGSIATALVVFVRAGRWQTAGDQITHQRTSVPRLYPEIFRGTDGGRQLGNLLILLCFWWAHKGSNLGPLPCEGNALPLSYAPGNFVLRQMSRSTSSEPAIYEAPPISVKLSGQK